MKTHYELLGLEPTADADAIKKAFRREIARYHPDKVIHLGAEFQEMAATRAAELTVAYKTLTDPALREEYDASMSARLPPPHVPQPPRAGSRRADAAIAAAADARRHRAAAAARRQGAASRPNAPIAIVILKRAIAGRVLGIVEALYGKVETPPVRGFDLAMVPVAKPRFLGAPPPRVLVKVVDTPTPRRSPRRTPPRRARGSMPASRRSWSCCLRARIAPQPELSKANDANARQRKAPDGPEEVAVVVVDTADWSCRLPPSCSAAVQKLTDQIC